MMLVTATEGLIANRVGSPLLKHQCGDIFRVEP